MWKNRQPKVDRYLKDAPDETQKTVREFLLGMVTAVSSQLMQWALETVKHLIVINAAGLAGVVAMYGGGYAPKVAATHAGVCFLIGICLAFAALASGYITGFITLRRMANHIADIIASTAPTHVLDGTVNNFFIVANWTLSAISLCVFILGVAKLIPIL
ncbi:hypothetical protein GQ56_0126430 [Burkholderia paludis]|uniref:hypothetical protein n=1 Tax=Burkholderia paludis TaxID=1506587 RepID=UPI0004DB5568|nr:hypothetical protein [Burkholderia paludis]KFG94397.1 hypothetical protein GQ56_0126430 [Burkholderia paludis]